MTIDPRWRAKIESLQRAGLQFVARERLAGLAGTPESLQDSAVEQAAGKELAVARAAKDSTSTEAKETALKILADEVAGCVLCPELVECRTQTVFSDGSASAEICFVGEAPGADEDRQGVPFVGRAGQLLTRIIEACKLQRSEVYICNVLKCRPPSNRNPEAEEIENCRPFLERQLEIIQPKMMVALGKFAAAHLLRQRPDRVPITKMRGQIREYCGIPFMITLHPAYLLRNPNAKRDVWEDMKTVMRQLGRPVD